MKNIFFSTIGLVRPLHSNSSCVVIATILSLLAAVTALGQASGGYQISQSVIASGGGASTNGSKSVEGTSGQTALGTSTNGGYTVTGGFWAGPVVNAPTATPASISGRVTTSDGLPIAGVMVTLSGQTVAVTVTDSEGVYSFPNAEAGGFYTVTPTLASYTFTPASRSISLLANRADAIFTAIPNAAAAVTISGRVTTSDGLPLGGVLVLLSGAGQDRSITNREGAYSFANGRIGGFYTLTAARANYRFAPATLSFSLLGNKADAAFTAQAAAVALENPLDTPEFFVRQQYLDLLGREPDQAGFNYWSEQLLACASDASCLNARRRDVAAAFFMEQEFQHTGSFIYDLYVGALGRRPAFEEFKADRQQVIAGSDLEIKQVAFAESFVQRAEFTQKYQTNASAESFVLGLTQNVRQATMIDLSARYESLIHVYNSGSSVSESRAAVLRAIADDADFKESQYNAAFVLTEYFTYLQRDADPAGFDFWVNVLDNGDAGNYRGMVCSFITSTEYQRRFSTVVTRNNGQCGP